MQSFLPTEEVVFTSMASGPVSSMGETTQVATTYTVPGCLVQPGSAIDLPQGYEPMQKVLVTVHVPSTFTADLIAGKATIRGRDFSIVTAGERWTESPLSWDRAVLCERSE